MSIVSGYLQWRRHTMAMVDAHLVVELEVWHNICEPIIDIPDVLEDRVALLIAVDEDCIPISDLPTA